MIDRKCPQCRDKAAVAEFVNEKGRFARLWKCQYCGAVWGVPLWDYVNRDNPHDFGLEPWMGNEPTKSLGSILLAFVQCDQARPVMFAMAIIVIAGSLFLRHWL